MSINLDYWEIARKLKMDHYEIYCNILKFIIRLFGIPIENNHFMDVSNQDRSQIGHYEKVGHVGDDTNCL